MTSPQNRPSLAILMGFTGMFAFGLAAMKVASQVALLATFALAAVALSHATLGMVVHRRRGPSIGFALFGWAFTLAAFSQDVRRSLMTETVLGPAATRVMEAFHPAPPRPAEPFAVLRRGLPDRRPEKIFYRGYSLVVAPFTPADERLWEDYEASVLSFRLRSEVRDRAEWIGGALLGLTLAMLGAVAGHLLDDRSQAVDTPPEARTPALSGRPVLD